MTGDVVAEVPSGWNCVKCDKSRLGSTVKLFVPGSARLPVGVPRGPYCSRCLSDVWSW